jgi:two-component system, OmpR family, alkaline phosphatase synthesis response regulator PhoP
MTKSVLVIEDDLEIMTNMEEMLELQAFQTIAATDGSLGLRLAKKQLPDLVVCDVMLPKLDGYSVLKELRQHEVLVTTPFIFVSAKSQRSDIRVAMELGADDYIVKPFTGRELMRSVETCINKYEKLLAKRASDVINGTRSLSDVQELQELSQVYLNLLETLSEDLRRPLANVMLALQMINTTASWEERDRYLSIIEEECLRQSAILNQSAQVQELLSTSGIALLRQLGLLKH